ncbi:hypothetical protein IWQ60_006713 [Tieghemiomyces parasiticus]|uniref:D-lactate dehydratase n=1 Tax=Tieghemiomyces parasiticus TaxID=78921 RepID=A0A9W8A2N1_9FUNG|nr:hypothetical protein IWQ60_006713 [Tieghemiomyces parasiticus]
MVDSKKVLVFVADGSEDIETVATIDVARRGGLAVTVVGVFLERAYAELANGVKLMPDARLEDLSDDQLRNFDALVIPGGNDGTQTLRSTTKVLQLLKQYHDGGKLVAAICAGPTVIQAAGLGLNGDTKLRLTSYPSVQFMLETQYDYQEEDVVVDGNLITSRGPGTTIPFGLAIVKHLTNEQVSRETAKKLLYEV